MKILYKIDREIDMAKNIARVKKQFKGKERLWLLKFYEHLIKEEFEELNKMWNNAPESQGSECSYREFVDIDVSDFIFNASHDKVSGFEIVYPAEKP